MDEIQPKIYNRLDEFIQPYSELKDQLKREIEVLRKYNVGTIDLVNIEHKILFLEKLCKEFTKLRMEIHMCFSMGAIDIDDSTNES